MKRYFIINLFNKLIFLFHYFLIFIYKKNFNVLILENDIIINIISELLILLKI